MSEFSVVFGTRLRLTKTNSCGKPIAGPANRLVTSGFVKVTMTPVMRDANDLEQANAEGKVCVAARTTPTRKWWTYEAEFCNVNTGVISLLTGWPVVLDYAGNPIGFEDQKEVLSDFGVALELWSGGEADDDCPIPTTDDILTSDDTGKRYGYFLTCGKEFTPSNIEIGEQVSTFTLSGITYPAPQWARGPYNVQEIDSLLTPGRLITPMGKGPHVRVFRTAVPPPDVTDGAVALAVDTIFTDPDFYYGGPSNAPAADVTPAQPADAGDSVALTITGVPTGGTFSLLITYLDTTTEETGTIVFNGTAANVKTALVAPDDGFTASDWTVTGTALPGGTVTIVPPPGVIVTPEDNNLTGGTTPTVVIT